MDGWNLILAWAIVALAAIVSGSVLLHRHKRYPGGSLLALGVLLLLAPVGFVAYELSPLTNPTSMFVEGLDPPNDPWFTVELRHTSTFHDGTEYWLGDAGAPERVADVFEDQHPQGVITTAHPVPMAQGGESIWHLSTEDVRYELVHFSDWYDLATQAVVVHASHSGPDVRIPFPRSAFNVTAVDEGEPYTNGWNEDQWADFYADIAKAHVIGNTITVPTNRGGTAIITLSDGAATVTVSPQPR